MGVGQAMSALAENVDALPWNVAGLAELARPSSNRPMNLSLSHQPLFEGASLDYAGFAAPLRGPFSRMAFGFTVTRLSYSDQEKRGPNRDVEGSFGISDMAVGSALAASLGPVQVGSQIKFIRQDLADESASGVALDLGGRMALPLPRLILGASVRNLGPRMKFIEEDYRLPLTLSLGAAYRFNPPLAVAVDVIARPYADQLTLCLGTELLPVPTLALRAGYLAQVAEAVTNGQKSETLRGNFVGMNGVAMGFGVKFNQFSLDYAIQPFGELGNMQNITLTAVFGRVPAREPASFALGPVPASATEGQAIDSRLPPQRVVVQFIFPPSSEPWWGTLVP